MCELSDKSVFILFQEVPGCSTCQQYGKEVLQHPLVVEAISELFVPLAIHNNKKGPDAIILAQYQEPAWNNPVVRIVDSNGKPIIDRLSGKYSAYAVVNYMKEALIAEKKEIPAYLSLLAEELYAEESGLKETYFSMFCFWTGEKQLAKQSGVVYTEAGFMDGKEVVKVRYAPSIISYDKLLERASKMQCASGVYSDDEYERKIASSEIGKDKSKYTKSFRKDSEDKYYLRHSNLRFLPLTDLQKTRINSMLGDRLDPTELLSPIQVKFLNCLDESGEKSMLDTEFREAWKKLSIHLVSE